MKRLLLLSTIICMSSINAMQRGRISDERRAQLQEQLEGSAFRRGVSGGVQGVVKTAPSDHSPIMVKYDGISIASWNLLSDEHTLNFFFDIGRKKYFADYKVDGKSLPWKDIFNDFTTFVFNNSSVNHGTYDITITQDFMNAFVTDKKSKGQDIKNAQAFVDLVLDRSNPHHEDIKTSLMHILEIKFGIDKGYLRWEDRLRLITKNKFLVNNLMENDFLCFQECTNPKDMLALVKNSRKNFVMLEHNVKAGSKDNCVIIYDKSKYELIKHHNFGLAENRKPSIVAEFRSLATGESFVVGSIHHAGTGKSEMSHIIKQVNHLLQGAQNMPIMILGDYNHQSDFYAQDLVGTEFQLKMPRQATMAGVEFGNLNKPIDGVLTNRPMQTTVNVLEQRMFASQVTLPMEIKFEI